MNNPECKNWNKTRTAKGQFRRFSIKEKIEAFWLKVQKLSSNECWEWSGTVLKNGYGWNNSLFNEVLSHRIAYILIYGSIPKGAEICHECDNRKCCNPFHLFPGSRSDNARDAFLKNRQKNLFQKGVPNLHVKIGEKDEKLICRFRRRKMNISKISAISGISRPTVYSILKRNNIQ